MNVVLVVLSFSLSFQISRNEHSTHSPVQQGAKTES